MFKLLWPILKRQSDYEVRMKWRQVNPSDQGGKFIYLKDFLLLVSPTMSSLMEFVVQFWPLSLSRKAVFYYYISSSRYSK